MNDIIDKYNDLREAIELADDLDPNIKDELMADLENFDCLLDELMDSQNDTDYDGDEYWYFKKILT